VALTLAGCSGHHAAAPPLEVRVGAFVLRTPSLTHSRHPSFYEELTSDAHPGLTAALGSYYGIRSPAAAALPRVAAAWLTGGSDHASWRAVGAVEPFRALPGSGATAAAVHYRQRVGHSDYHGLLVLVVDDAGDALVIDTYASGSTRAWKEIDDYARSLVLGVRPAARSSRTAS
jgi:hypothetical protein